LDDDTEADTEAGTEVEWTKKLSSKHISAPITS
jgi:hypothetical protein